MCTQYMYSCFWGFSIASYLNEYEWQYRYRYPILVSVLCILKKVSIKIIRRRRGKRIVCVGKTQMCSRKVCGTLFAFGVFVLVSKTTAACGEFKGNKMVCLFVQLFISILY